MKSLISRDSHRREERYSGVFQVQGGMVTDADFLERTRITQDRTDNLGIDSIKNGIPNEGGAVTRRNGDLFLREGAIYADGVRGYLTAKDGADLTESLSLFSEQADFPKKPSLPGGDLVIYADIWERPVFPLEDPYLADSGLHGAVTAFRTRTMTQLKAALHTNDVERQIENGEGRFPRIGTATLDVKENNAETVADECDPCADVVSVDQIVPNELWRLEVVDVEGTPDAPVKITLAWSIENAAAIAPRDVDPEKFKRPNKVYEFYSENTECNLGVFDNASDAERSVFVADLTAGPEPWPFVRRWDGHAVIDMSDNTDPVSLGGGTITRAGKTIKLKVDAFEATLNLDGAAVVAGDYWLVELRRFAREKEDRVHLVKETPIGVEHHFCVLFRVFAGEILPLSDARIRKLSFPTLSNLPASHIGFDNTCGKLYANAENVQEALKNLCAISAEDIAFKPDCEELYGENSNVQDALDNLCNINFSVDASFRLMFDWGVLCGLVPSLTKPFTGNVKIPAGAFMDRSGKVKRFDGGDFDLSNFELKKEILYNSVEDLQTDLQKDQVCLALAASEGGEVSVYVAPRGRAFGPNDPGFGKLARNCVGKKTIIDIDDVLANLPKSLQAVAGKIFLGLSGNGSFDGSAKLKESEAKNAEKFHAVLFGEFEKVASKEEIQSYKLGVEKAKKENPIGNSVGAARQIRHMQLATAIFTVFTESEEERLRRCMCEAMFPTCPPELGKEPYLVPIACLRGAYELPRFFLKEVCPFLCRKQAMTTRAVQHFIGGYRNRMAKQLARRCCGQEEKDVDIVVKPPKFYKPDFFKNIDFIEAFRNFDFEFPGLGFPPKVQPDYEFDVSVNDLNIADATKTLTGSGFDVITTIDIDDEQAFDIIHSKSDGVSNTERLIAGQSVRPGDKVGLLVQHGVARGYVLLERGSGKLPFPTRKAGLRVDISKEDELKATELIAATDTAKGELTGLVRLRETLSADVIKLKTDVEALSAEREKSVAAVTEAETRLTELAKSRTEITKDIEAVNKELAAAEENRKTIVTAVRRSQPVTAVVGNKKPELIAKLAGEGITSVADISKLTDAKIRALREAGILNVAEAGILKRNAETFIKRPMG